MVFFLSHIRDVFARSHSRSQEILLSRRAFFRLLGYLASCVLFSLIAQDHV
ncbi:LAMI_0G14268g1_1 [Lachancea mirantina]|uniref:LAMI_0G14268g1_1 n=1 Tax=Lachancea mirantina TaxID=1230905 RepID=A0A1G4KBY3_9SACH|nr:LAMI_0G14268g1_1 [Lachancea mirantina]